MKTYLADQYLDFVNNFLSRKGFALYHDISLVQAELILSIGKQLHEERVERYKIEK